MEEMQTGRDGRKLWCVIEAATHSPLKELDAAHLKTIKNLVRSSDNNVHAAVGFLMDIMNKNHSQVRYLAVLIIDELFSRSKLFRGLWVHRFERFLLLSVGFRKEHSLPPPSDRASLLRSKTLEFLEVWNNKFGQHYRQLRLGYNYLKNILRLQFPNPNPAIDSRDADRQRQQRAARSQELLRSKFQTLSQNFPAFKSEVHSTINEIERCFEILKQQQEEKDKLGVEDFEEYEYTSSTSAKLRRIREEAMNEEQKLVESRDNEAVFDVVRELYKLLTTRHLPTIQEWLQVVMKVDLPNNNNASESMLKEVIDLRNTLQSARGKCEGLGCKLTADTQEDEVMWEEGVIEAARSDEKLASGLVDDKDDKAPEVQESICPSGECSKAKTAPLSQKLLQEAPVLPWGSYLDTWGSNSATPANQRGLEVENHWGRVDSDAVIPPERAAEFNVRATYYKDQQPEIQPCNAPLRNGGLCQRQDLRVCPFHGPIKPRDSHGNPIEEKPNSAPAVEQPAALRTEENDGKRTSTASTCEIEDADMLSSQLKSVSSEEQTVRLIAAKAVENVRSRDEELKKRKHADSISARKAKLKKVREHNDSVLRASAMISTRQGLGEAMGEDLEGCSDSMTNQKKAKQTLSSMLKKKTTPKDRLAQKLLNARVSDATVRQVTKDEEIKYKHSFANQW